MRLAFVVGCALVLGILAAPVSSATPPPGDHAAVKCFSGKEASPGGVGEGHWIVVIWSPINVAVFIPSGGPQGSNVLGLWDGNYVGLVCAILERVVNCEGFNSQLVETLQEQIEALGKSLRLDLSAVVSIDSTFADAPEDPILLGPPTAPC